jgi:hypothetical protein
MLAGVEGLDAEVGGVLGFEAPEDEGPLDIGVEGLVLETLAPLPAAPDPIGLVGVADAGVELLLGFVTTVVVSEPSSDPHAHRPSRLSAIATLDAPRKYMIFLRMPWHPYAPERAFTTSECAYV